jgi:ribosomal protein S18 acetylase RimI-like enzyme
MTPATGKIERMTEFKLRPAQSLTLAERVALFNAAYEGYVMPFHLEEPALSFMERSFDMDLEASRVAFRDGEPVGLANLAIRGDEGWIGGVGVVSAARREGLGETLMRAVHDEARARGLRRVWLEVIVENTGAFALYEKLGYETAQDVEVWMLDGAEGEHDAREVRAEEIELPPKHEPWQRAAGTLANYDDVRGLVTETGAMLFCPRPKKQPQQYTGEPEPLIRALRTYGDLYWLNLPADDPAAEVLRELGGTVTVRQHEMVLEL